MEDKLFLNAIKLKGELCPSWKAIPNDTWEKILSDYFFKISDSFGFANVLETKNLSINGFDFFDNWDLKEIELVEFENEIVCRFDLNEDCKEKLLEYDFSVHQKGEIRSYWNFDQDNYYYEFDILYFFNGNELKGYYINHENMIGFVNNPVDIKLLDTLDSKITKHIIDSEELKKAFRNRQASN